MRFLAYTAVVCVLFLFTSTATAATLCSGGAQVITLPEKASDIPTLLREEDGVPSLPHADVQRFSRSSILDCIPQQLGWLL